MRIQNSLVAALVLLLAGPFAAPGTADAQILKRAMKRAEKKVEQRVERKADRAVDKALDKTKAGLTCVVTDADCIAKAKREGRDVTPTDAVVNRVEAPAAAARPSISAADGAVEGVPAWVPLPETYVVNLNTPRGPVASAVLEYADDPRALMARMNAALAAAGFGEGSLREQSGEDGRFRAFGVLDPEGGSLIITIGEYEPGGARIAGNKGSVTYQLMRR
jgi:hypothetical protein